MFSTQNTQVSTKFQNAGRKSVGTKDVPLNTSQRRLTKVKSPTGFVHKPSISRTTAKGKVNAATPTPTVKSVENVSSPKQRPVQSSVPTSPKINQTKSTPIRCSDGKTKPKSMDLAVALLKPRSGLGATGSVDITRHHGQKARGLGNYVLSQRRIVRPSSSAIFDYDLSQVEQNNFRHCQSRDPPMKSVPHDELQLLQSGQRTTYLEQRYDRTPDVKYNYPQATSWRYGWFHRQTQSKIGDTL